MGYIRSHDDVLGLVLLSAVFSFLVFPNLLVLMPLYVYRCPGRRRWLGLDHDLGTWARLAGRLDRHPSGQPA